VIRLWDLYLPTTKFTRYRHPCPRCNSNPNPRKRRSQTHDLVRPKKDIGFSIIYSFYLAIRSTYMLPEEHNKEQENETN